MKGRKDQTSQADEGMVDGITKSEGAIMRRWDGIIFIGRPQVCLEPFYAEGVMFRLSARPKDGLSDVVDSRFRNAYCGCHSAMELEGCRETPRVEKGGGKPLSNRIFPGRQQTSE